MDEPGRGEAPGRRASARPRWSRAAGAGGTVLGWKVTKLSWVIPAGLLPHSPRGWREKGGMDKAAAAAGRRIGGWKVKTPGPRGRRPPVPRGHRAGTDHEHTPVL